MSTATHAIGRTGCRPTSPLKRRSAIGLHGQSPILLFRRCRGGDESAREALVRLYLPLARSLARRYARSSEPYEDLTQVASLALVKAVGRFDPERGVDFRAFAIPTILGELKRYFRDSAWAVHVPRSTQERALLVEDANEQLTGANGRPPSVTEIATHLELSTEDVLDGLKAAQAYGTLSLDESLGGSDDSDAVSLGDTLGAEDERYELIEADVATATALRSLSDRDRRILYLRFVKEWTQSEIADEIGVSQMQVSRLLRGSLSSLRAFVEEPSDEPEDQAA